MYLKGQSGAKKQRKQLKSKKQEELTEQELRDLAALDDLAAPRASEKQAFLMWGGGEAGLHPKGRGIGGALGYSNLLGLLPVPTGNIDIGGPKHGFQLGVAADPESEFGVSPLIGARFNHPRKSGLTRQFPRGLPEVIYDKLRGRTKEDAIRASYPELFEGEEEAQPRDGDGDGKVNDGTDEETEVKELAKAAAHFAKRAYGVSDDHIKGREGAPLNWDALGKGQG
jgi:hypothetical protein